MKTFNRISIFSAIILGSLFMACNGIIEGIGGVNQNVKDLIDVLDDGIDQIVGQSSDWQETLSVTPSKSSGLHRSP